MKLMDDRVGRLLQDGRDYTKRFWHWHLSRSLNPDQHQAKNENPHRLLLPLWACF